MAIVTEFLNPGPNVPECLYANLMAVISVDTLAAENVLAQLVKRKFSILLDGEGISFRPIEVGSQAVVSVDRRSLIMGSSMHLDRVKSNLHTLLSSMVSYGSALDLVPYDALRPSLAVVGEDKFSISLRQQWCSRE